MLNLKSCIVQKQQYYFPSHSYGYPSSLISNQNNYIMKNRSEITIKKIPKKIKFLFSAIIKIKHIQMDLERNFDQILLTHQLIKAL